MKKFLFGFALIISLACIALGKPTSRSSSGSFGGSRSYSSPSKPSYSAPKAVSPSRSSSGIFGSSSKSVTPQKPSVTTKSSGTDSKMSQSLKTTSSSYKTKESAIDAFKKENAGKFTSKYEKEPSTRPTHIPQSTTVDGRSVTVNYNSNYGGYGYMHPVLGTWIMYDMMSDAAMVNSMAHHHGYGYAASGYNYSFGWFNSVIFTVVFICVLLIILSGTYI